MKGYPLLFVRNFLKWVGLLHLAVLLITVSAAEKRSRGIGIYPGDPREDFSPSLRADARTYRNIALLRPVYGSGSYDFYLTPQLITDGVIETEMPGWLVVSSSQDGIYPRPDREKLVDRNVSTRMVFDSANFWVQIEQAGHCVLPAVDGFRFSGTVSVDTCKKEIEPWSIRVTGSSDGAGWQEIGVLSGTGLVGDTLTGYRRNIYPQNYRVFHETWRLPQPVRYSFYRAEFSSANIESWRLAEVQPMDQGEPCSIGGPYAFSSAWKSAGAQQEWLYVDLGAICAFDRIDIFWLRRAESGSILISDDARSWKKIAELPKNSAMNDVIRFDLRLRARYVRLNLNRALSPADGYIISEMEIYGTGAPVAVAHPQARAESRGVLPLSGGAWKLQRSSLAADPLTAISQTGYDDRSWIQATVPGTVLVSYLNNGMIPDPDYGDNQFLISDSYFYSDFIYRDEFLLPGSWEGSRIFIHLDGINWKADLYLNGKKCGRVEGAFARGKWDVTDAVRPGRRNALAVYICKNLAPGFVKEPTLRDHQANGGELGLDNPTFHASVGWDWFPSTRGRNIGIWNEIWLSKNGSVTLEDPCVSSRLPLPDTTSADLTIQVTLVNHQTQPVSGKLAGSVGAASFSLPVSLAGAETRTIALDPSRIAALHIAHPRLWWPNGYGKPSLYDVRLEFISAAGLVSNSRAFKTGIRELSYSEEGGRLKIWINGKRFIARGGNWGFSESNLRYRSREYDIAVRYHREMNLNMLRNWVGQTGDDEFFAACDKYGIMVWQDFWLANPGDGPNPADTRLFMQNAEDFVKRIRNHPAIALYCGRNEGYPPAEIDSALRVLLPRIAPGIHYISSSADEVVSGHGPYAARSLRYYFQERATPKLHSEIGLPAPVSWASLQAMMPDSTLWPVQRLWAVHDFSMESAQEGDNFMRRLEDHFGKVDNAREWLEYAQWLSYQGFRGILEAQARNRMGVLFWMTHCAWPSFVFQTYDYYFEPTGAYFGCKKGSEPLHILWNAATDSIEVVNMSIAGGSNLIATVELINLDGSTAARRFFNADCPIDQVRRICRLERPAALSPTHFIRLRLEQRGRPVAENFYWSSRREEDFHEIAQLAKVKLDLRVRSRRQTGKWFLSANLANSSSTPALMVRLEIMGAKDKERILPAVFSDNFISLMPGEQRQVEIEVDEADCRGGQPMVALEGVNLR
ncbi:MAG TPA: discoidin domain-containing protein [bacterium]|nr:discoidin domain-containing protein [bacterium]HPR87928.1 discoidin domain-containing protein [bacterium]